MRRPCTTGCRAPGSAAATTSPIRRSARAAPPASRSASWSRNSSPTGRSGSCRRSTPTSPGSRCRPAPRPSSSSCSSATSRPATAMATWRRWASTTTAPWSRTRRSPPAWSSSATRQDRLLGACLTDWLSDGLSAVYSFFDPAEARRSLGSWAILWLVARARALGLPYVYLGYWVPESRKMSYKSRYRPSEMLTGGVWRVLEDSMVPAEPRDGAGDGGVAAGDHPPGVTPCRTRTTTARVPPTAPPWRPSAVERPDPIRAGSEGFPGRWMNRIEQPRIRPLAPRRPATALPLPAAPRAILPIFDKDHRPGPVELRLLAIPCRGGHGFRWHDRHNRMVARAPGSSAASGRAPARRAGRHSPSPPRRCGMAADE